MSDLHVDTELPVIQVLQEDGTIAKGMEPGLSKDDLVNLYRHMLMVRVLDDRMMTLQRQGRLGFYLTTRGEEATHIGSTYALRDDDLVYPCYREHGSAFVRGFSLQDYVNQCYGNSEDPHKGRQMPNHWGSAEHNLVTISSPVGTQIAHAAGSAMASQVLDEDTVTLVYFGDGATSQGDFHVGMNFAGVYKAPCIFFCRNNGYAISVPTERQTANTIFAQKAVAYGFPGVRVNGNDILAVYKVTKEAAERARAGEGPTLIEALTYRRGAHSSSDDPTRYRTSDEEQYWDARDPLHLLRKHLEVQDLWNEDKQKAAEEEYLAQVKEAITTAESLGKPGIESLFEDLFDELPDNIKEQRDDLLAYYAKEGK